jgi:hypothetical protein
MNEGNGVFSRAEQLHYAARNFDLAINMHDPRFLDAHNEPSGGVGPIE